jgi:hypothetical protein
VRSSKINIRSARGLKRNGGMMISTDCRIESFFDAIEGRTFTEAVILANQEATEAERALLQHKHTAMECPCPVEYVDSLKEFLLFMRCAVLRNRISKHKYQKLFHSYLKSAP